MGRLTEAMLFTDLIDQVFDARVFMDCDDFAATKAADVVVMLNEDIGQLDLILPAYLNLVYDAQSIEEFNSTINTRPIDRGRYGFFYVAHALRFFVPQGIKNGCSCSGYMQ